MRSVFGELLCEKESISVEWLSFLPPPSLMTKPSVHCPSTEYTMSFSLPAGYMVAEKEFFLPDSQPLPL